MRFIGIHSTLCPFHRHTSLRRYYSRKQELNSGIVIRSFPTSATLTICRNFTFGEYENEC